MSVPELSTQDLQSKSHTPQDSALLRAIIDATRAYLSIMYKGVLSGRLHTLLNRSVTDEKAEADSLIRFQKLLCGLPFCTSDFAFLSLAVNGEFQTRKEMVTVPPCVAILWDEVLAQNPWILHYVASAGEVRNQCSKVLHGVETWKETDVSVVLAKSDFTSDVQDALRDIAPDFPFIL
ncbi:hypothetical protein C8R44DRAFT_985911 [Mycena epipterygia]|nr:hypothetical protein C8R44DRAFT_985911 [Mycena epipterygia]